jgi:hypothetical protein
MHVLGHQRRLDALSEFVTGVDLDMIFSESDFIVLTCPLRPETRNLVNQSRIDVMKRSACVVNASRGPVVDEQALVAALRERRIAGAVLDVYCEQPLRCDHPLLGLKNVVLTRHVAGITRESMERLSEGAAREMLRHCWPASGRAISSIPMSGMPIPRAAVTAPSTRHHHEQERNAHPARGGVSFIFPCKAVGQSRRRRAVKRDTVVVKVTIPDGLVGWQESHHRHCPSAVANIVNTTLR